MNEKFLIEKMEEGYLFYLKDGIIKNVEIPVYGKLTLVYQDGKMIYLEKAETIKQYLSEQPRVNFFMKIAQASWGFILGFFDQVRKEVKR